MNDKVVYITILKSCMTKRILKIKRQLKTMH